MWGQSELTTLKFTEQLQILFSMIHDMAIKPLIEATYGRKWMTVENLVVI
jgi:hypothetical protein